MIHCFRSRIKDTIYASNTTDIDLLSQKLNLDIRDYYNYFGRYNSSEAFRQGTDYVNRSLVRWLKRIRKKIKRSWAKSQHLLYRIVMSSPEMFCIGKLNICR